MREDTTRGDNAAARFEAVGSSGWVGTQQAAKALGISARTVRWHIEQGNLEAKPEGEGVKRTWLVSIDSLQAFKDSRQHAVEAPQSYRANTESADIAPESLGNPIRELADRLAEEAAKAAEYRVRFEITERAQSTLEEQLVEERFRREAAERRAEKLEHRLAETRDAHETPSEGTQIVDTTDRSENPQTAPERRSWWRRFFGFD